MSFFKSEYQDALMTNRDYITSSKSIYNKYPNVSLDSISNLYYLLNYGDIEVKYPYSITLNSLNAYLILFTLTGQGLVFYQDETYLLQADSVLFLDCHQSFKIEVFNSSNWSYQWLYINGNATPYYHNRFMKDLNPVYQCRQSSNIHTVMNTLMDYMSNKEVNELISSMLINKLLTNLVIEKDSPNSHEHIPPYIIKIQKLFDTKYYDNYDLEDLAKMFKISKFTLSKEFTKHIKVSPIEYLINKRIHTSKKLLKESEYTVSEIAAKVGIDNPTHFINLFKKRVGITPLQYRKHISKDLSLFNDF